MGDGERGWVVKVGNQYVSAIGAGGRIVTLTPDLSKALRDTFGGAYEVQRIAGGAICYRPEEGGGDGDRG